MVVAGAAALIALFNANESRARGGAVAPYTEIKVDLHVAAIRDALPFDVPCVLVGTAPPYAMNVRVAFARTTDYVRQRGPKRMPTTSYSSASSGTTPPLSRCGQPDPSSIDNLYRDNPTVEWRQIAAPLSTEAPFHVAIPDLQALQYYRFRFTILRQLTPEDAAKFLTSATLMLDRFFDNILNAELANDQAKAMRCALRLVLNVHTHLSEKMSAFPLQRA